MILVQQWRELRRRQSIVAAAWSMLVLWVEAAFFKPSTTGLLDQDNERLNLEYWYPNIRWARPRLLDPLRFVVQTLWLIFFKTSFEREQNERSAIPSKSVFRATRDWQKSLIKRVLYYPTLLLDRIFRGISLSRSRAIEALHLSLMLAAFAVLIFLLTLPMEATEQGLLLLLFWGIALWVREIRGRIPMLLMILLSVFVSTRYLIWRVTQTINWDVPLDASFGILLLIAEVYAWLILVLGYIQTIWPLRRSVVNLPEDPKQWPTVDVFIPSYNEPLDVVRTTVVAATAMDWPKDKLNIYVLDDGKRAEFAKFCEEIGVHYMTRPDNSHAKAGNLNHALKQTKGDFVTIFDCDHIPSRGFLQLTLGWFSVDPKLALMQTPHHFFSPDPFERNLSVFRSRPNEGELFYGLIQDGNDMWNASFFCGSCAVLKRGPLEEVGGIAVETVTEDAHTALKLHRLGYNSAYLNVPLAAGLATESLSAHIGQRIRWARGMAQIFRLDNPLRGKGLTWGQRICYLNAMLYFLNGIPRTIFLLAPLAFLLLHSYIVFAPAIMIAMYAIPHLIHANLANSRAQGAYRHSFWAEMYETVLSWYILRPTTVALISPQHGKFNVTAKGGTIPEQYFDWKISTPYLVLMGISLVGFGFGVYGLLYGPRDELLTVSLNLAWITYNLIILGGAVAVAEESKQERATHRIVVNRPVKLYTPSEHCYSAELVDFSASGAGLKLVDELALAAGDRISIVMAEGDTEHAFNARVISMRGRTLGVRFELPDLVSEQAYVRATFARADAWVGWRLREEKEKPLSSLREIISIGLKGYQRIVLQLAPKFVFILTFITRIWEGLLTLLPQNPGSGDDDDAMAHY